MYSPDQGHSSPIVIPFTGFQSAAHLMEMHARGAEINGLADLDAGIKAKIPDALPYARNCSREILFHFTVLRVASLYMYERFALSRIKRAVCL